MNIVGVKPSPVPSRSMLCRRISGAELFGLVSPGGETRPVPLRPPSMKTSISPPESRFMSCQHNCLAAENLCALSY
jgi:hypothetical protein